MEWVESQLGVIIESKLSKDVDYSDLQWSILEMLTFILSFTYIYLSTYYLNKKKLSNKTHKNDLFKELVKNPKTFLIFSIVSLLVFWSILALIELIFFGNSVFISIISAFIKECKNYTTK